MKSVLAAIDFSAGGRRIIAEAVVLARSLGARLVVLHVVEPPLGTEAEAGRRIRSSIAPMMSEAAAAALGKLQKDLKAEGVTVQTWHLVGSPGRRIVDYARELHADFVVMGSHDRGAPRDSVAGRTERHVLKYAPCAVVVVRPRQEPPGKPRPTLLRAWAG